MRLWRIKSWLTQKALNLVVWLNRDSNYLAHVRREVPEWFAEDDDEPNRWMADGTVELLAVLSHHGHSGGSIGFALNFFKTMARFEPWGPLTGEDDEWNEVGEGTEQNRRCSHVFREGGQAYDSTGKVFTDPDGFSYTSCDSCGDITFPYTPHTEYVTVEEED